MRKWLSLLLATAALSHAAELPAFYNQVDRLIWMTKDVDATLAAWKSAGVIEIIDTGEVDDEAQFRGKTTPARYKWTDGAFAGVRVMWAQALSGTGLFVDFTKQHGEGVAAVLHRAPTEQDFEAEVKRMAALGVGVAHRSYLGEGVYYAVFDTAREGKYYVGIVFDPAPAAALSRRVSQYAFVIRDHAPVSQFWAKLGWPAMSLTNPSLTGHEYRGKPTTAKATLGWQRHGKVVYEWIIPQPAAGASAWTDQLTGHGEGFHHFGMQVDDMDAAIAEWRKAGFELTQAGGWGEKGQKGSGRFAYLASKAGGGVDIELLWNFR